MIVPAHNEERCIARLAASLAAQDHAAEKLHVTFALDRCTDGTADVLRQSVGHLDHFSILELGEHTEQEQAEGWSGKPRALWRGVTGTPAAGKADVLLFVDADTELHPACIRATLALLARRELEMLSLLSTLTTEQWFERVAQPVASIEIVRQYPLLRANNAERRRAFANGQFIMIRRAAYEAIGGHKAVRTAILEDIELARLLHADRRPIGLFIADGMLRCTMYPSWEKFQSGWKRIYTECANRKPKRLRRSAQVMLLIGIALPILAAVGVGGGGAAWTQTDDPLALTTLITGSAALALMLVVLGWAYRVSRAPLSAVLAYPAGSWLVARILADAARDLEEGRPTVWAGKTYAREAR